MDPVDKAKDSMGSVEKAIFGLPGIKGYREKDMRRDADKQMRESLARQLDERRRRLTSLQSQLLSNGGLLWMDDLERVVSRLTTLGDRIRTASYGYAGFFDLQQVKEEELDRLAAFDRALFDDLAPLDEAIGALQKAIETNEGIKETVQALSDRLAQMNDTFSRRAEAIQSAQ